MGHSILVSTFIFEGGPKNPSKGTSMKLLVFALDAQSRVNAGSKESGAIRNGMRAMTLNPWRLVLQDYTCNVVNATCSVACLELVWWTVDQIMVHRPMDYSYCSSKPTWQKRLENELTVRKTPRLHVNRGLKYDLSGSPVDCWETTVISN